MVSPTDPTVKNGKSLLPGTASIDGAQNHSVVVQPGDSIPVYFDAIAEKAGEVQAVFTINSKVLNERLICSLIIERPYIFETFATIGSIVGNNTEALEKLVMPSFADNGQGNISITLDATRLGLLGDAVQYVFNYPYGCLEQQSSAILPLVIFGDYIDAFGLEKNVKITDVKSLALSYFKDWKQYQFSSGGFGYWPPSSIENYDLSI